MLNLVITGSDGFIGKNLYYHLYDNPDYNLRTITRADDDESIEDKLRGAHIVFHLAGVNRPENETGFHDGNVYFTEKVIDWLKRNGDSPAIIFASSIQATRQNAYGISKKNAEERLRSFGERSGAQIIIYRLPNVFGKWSRPHYNSVVATFCHNIANDMPIDIHDPGKELELVYIDDVVQAMCSHIQTRDQKSGDTFYQVAPVFRITLQDLADTIYNFRKIREHHTLPDFSDLLKKYLYTTYLSFLSTDDFSYQLTEKSDERGMLVELLKTDTAGQIFVSTTRPGVVRGNHYHHTKVEKFCVIKGSAIIRFRKIDSPECINYEVSDDAIKIVDIPPGYTHNIENTGADELIVLFWANEKFNPGKPDTYYLPVQ